jgi:nitroreductase
MVYRHPVSDLIRLRFSCRTYSPEPIGAEERRILEQETAAIASGPLGTPLRFRLIAATAEDHVALKGLGTYGFIRGASAFIVGAAHRPEENPEDFGFRMEQIVLLCTDLGLGSCWLGGTFTQSSFAGKISLEEDEDLPAVVSAGRMAGEKRARDGAVRLLARSKSRFPREDLFFDGTFAAPLTEEAAGPYAGPLEMVRLGPSASNKQPWRILRAGGDWHFYLQRTAGYREGFFQRILRLADLQRIDMGIAMCHFELAARERGLRGAWIRREPAHDTGAGAREYVITWSDTA